jgi:hypothetical protein
VPPVVGGRESGSGLVSGKKQLIDALYEVRALAAHISQGEFQVRDLSEAQQELSRRLSIAVQADAADAPDSSAEDSGKAPSRSQVAASLSQVAAESTAAAEVFRQRFSVESIDAYIQVVTHRV